MNQRNLWVGILVAVAIVLFGTGLFLIGNQHRAFRHHVVFYSDLANVDGIGKGAKVRVNGMDAGEVEDISIPSRPSQKFRIKLKLDERLHGLIREDSLVSIETEGLVGDKFLLVRSGTDQSPEAPASFTLPSKEPFEIRKMLDKANGLLTQMGGTITQVNGTIADVQGHLDGALGAVTTTVNNTNGIITDIRRGKGTAGVLLEDPATAANVRHIVTNTQQATQSLQATADQVNGIVQDVQQRRLVAKIDDTLNSAKSASQQLDQASRQVNTTLQTALGPDQYGRNGGVNLRQSLTNVNHASGNLADDTEALKHEFFFRGFFKSRGYDNLDQIPVQPYRNGKIFRKLSEDRQWIDAPALFTESPDGTETLSAAGRLQLDNDAARIDGLHDSPLIVEGYADAGTPADQLIRSRERAALVRTYLQHRFQIAPKNTGIIGLSATPPSAAAKSTWNGICLVHLSKSK